MTPRQMIAELKKLDQDSDLHINVLNRILLDGFAIAAGEAVMALDKGQWVYGLYLGLDEKGVPRIKVGSGKEISPAKAVPFAKFSPEMAASEDIK